MLEFAKGDILIYVGAFVGCRNQEVICLDIFQEHGRVVIVYRFIDNKFNILRMGDHNSVFTGNPHCFIHTGSNINTSNEFINF